MKLDMTLDDVQNSRFSNIYHDLIKQKVKETPLLEVELNCILMAYYKFVLANGRRAKYMTKMQFSYFFEVYFQIYDLRIIERIIMTLSKDDSVAKMVLPTAWVNMYLVYTTESLEEQMEFCFHVYDIHGSGFITRDVVTRFVQYFMVEDEDDTEELLMDMLDLILKRFDVDRDGKISYNDYCTTVRATPSLMQFLGTCIPMKNVTTVFNRKTFRGSEN